jgi:hypothetical protein
MENFPLHNLIYIEPIVNTQRNYSHGTIIVPINFILRRFVIANPYVDVPLHLTARIPSDSKIAIKSIQPYLGCHPSKHVGGVVVTSTQCVPYFKPYRKPFNYSEYKEKNYPNFHVQVFIAIIKTNLFKFTLKDNALDWCNNCMRDHPNL